MMTGIICNSRRTVYLPTLASRSLVASAPAGPSRPGALGTCEQRRWADRKHGQPTAPVLLRGDLGVDRNAEGVDLDVLDPVGPGHVTGRVPQRDDPHVLSETQLGLLVEGVRLVQRLGRGGLLGQLLELRVVEVEVVRRGALGVDRHQEVLDGRVVHLPTVAEQTVDLALTDVGEEGGEVDRRGRLALDVQRLPDRVARGLGPRTVVGVTVVGQREVALDATRRVPQLLRGLGVVDAGLAALVGDEAVNDR